MICRQTLRTIFNYRFDKLETLTSKLDELVSDQAFEKIKPFLLPTKSFLTLFALHTRGLGIDLLKMTKKIIETIETDKNQEYLIQPVWTISTDWNEYFSVTKKLNFKDPQVFFTGRKSCDLNPIFQPCTLNYSIAHTPYFISQDLQRKGFYVDKFRDLALKDLKSFLEFRHGELKLNGKLILFSDLRHKNSPNQLLNSAKKLYESFEDFNQIERSKLTINAQNLSKEEIESLFDEFKDKFQVLHKEVLTNEIFVGEKPGPDKLGELYTQYVKEKIGYNFHYTMKSARAFDDREKLMTAYFLALKNEFEKDLPTIKQKTLVSLLEKIRK